MYYFEQYQRRLISLIGLDKARKLVNNALVLITLGGNDFVNNYFLAPITARRIQFNLQDYTTFLIAEYKKILKVNLKKKKKERINLAEYKKILIRLYKLN